MCLKCATILLHVCTDMYKEYVTHYRMQEWLCWYVRHRDDSHTTRTVLDMVVEGVRPRERPTLRHMDTIKGKKKGMVLYSAVSSPLDRSKRFTLSSPGRPVHSDTVLGFSWKHSSHAAIAQRLFTHISTTVYSQVLIYTAESTEASWNERKCPNF